MKTTRIFGIATIAVSALLTACTNNDEGTGPSWPTEADLKAAAPEGRTITADEYRWLTFATCGTYATFGAYHYVTPESLNGYGRDNQTVMAASIAKARDGIAATSGMPDRATGHIEWPGTLGEWEEDERYSAMTAVVAKQCPELQQAVTSRLFSAGVRAQ